MQHSSDSNNPRSLADLFFYGLEDRLLEVRVFEPRRLSAIPESLVQSIWKSQNFGKTDLRTTKGETLEIVSPGRFNTDAGPDFLDARIIIGGVDWRGDVEIHVASRMWKDHKHHENSRYNSTILHCVLFSDNLTSRLKREDQTELPELVLEPYLKRSLRGLLPHSYANPSDRLPCQPLSHLVSTSLRLNQIEEQATIRLREKKNWVETAFLRTPDLESILHQLLFAGLGYAKNTESMMELARRIPLGQALAINDSIDLEALHFGVSGLLPGSQYSIRLGREAADYVAELRVRFMQMQKFYQIPIMASHAWHFFRLRPANFPTLRIAQAASLLSQEMPFRHGILGAFSHALTIDSNLPAIRKLMKVSPSKFWQTHYRFDGPTKPRNPQIGESRFRKLLINAIIPVMLVHADHTNQLELEERIISLLKLLKPESDVIVSRFQDAGFISKNAYLTQGIHQQYQQFCVQKRCLECRIGNQIVTQNL